MQSLDNDEVIEPALYTSLSIEDQIHEPFWYVTLSNGEKAYSKSNQRCWLQLKEWLKINPSIRITGLYFGFRDNIISVYTGEGDYFFTNVYNGWYGGSTYKSYIGGIRQDNIIKTVKYRVPEVYFEEESERPLDDPSAIKGLINDYRQTN